MFQPEIEPRGKLTNYRGFCPHCNRALIFAVPSLLEEHEEGYVEPAELEKVIEQSQEILRSFGIGLESRTVLLVGEKKNCPFCGEEFDLPDPKTLRHYYGKWKRFKRWFSKKWKPLMNPERR